MKRGRFWAKVSSDGLHLPSEVLSKAGVGEGDLMEIQTLPKSELHSVSELLASGELKHGVSVTIGAPSWEDGTWSAAVLDSQSGEILGYATREARDAMLQFSRYPPKTDLIAPPPCSIQKSFSKGSIPMHDLIIEPCGSGIHLDPSALEDAGIDPSRRLAIVTLPNSEEIVYRALAFVIRKLGFAIGVSQPTWDGSEWTLRLIAPDEETDLGKLVLNVQGQVIEEKSATRESVRTIPFATSPAGTA